MTVKTLDGQCRRLFAQDCVTAIGELVDLLGGPVHQSIDEVTVAALAAVVHLDPCGTLRYTEVRAYDAGTTCRWEIPPPYDRAAAATALVHPADTTASNVAACGWLLAAVATVAVAAGELFVDDPDAPNAAVRAVLRDPRACLATLPPWPRALAEQAVDPKPSRSTTDVVFPVPVGVLARVCPPVDTLLVRHVFEALLDLATRVAIAERFGCIDVDR